MALDGALNGLSSAFDASVAFLIRAIEDAGDVDIEERLPVFRYSWPRCRDMLELPEIADERVWSLIVDIDAAIDGETLPQPTGWLAQLRRLRNRVAHQESLSRHHESGRVTGITIQGQTTDAFLYLAENCDHLHGLTERMIRAAISIGAPEASTAWNRKPWSAEQH